MRRRHPLQDVRRFATMAEPGALVLDAGCGPASDLRVLRDAGLHPVGVDLSIGNLREARMLLPRQPLVRAPYERLPFRPKSFRGLWASNAFAHQHRADWPKALTTLLEFVAAGPVYFSCVRGDNDLAAVDDPILGTIYRSDATEDEVERLLLAHQLRDLTVEVRPDPILDRRRPWVVALGRYG